MTSQQVLIFNEKIIPEFVIFTFWVYICSQSIVCYGYKINVLILFVNRFPFCRSSTNRWTTKIELINVRENPNNDS